MQTNHRRIERIGQHFAALGLVGGFALLAVTLFLDRTRQDCHRPFGRIHQIAAAEKEAPVVEEIRRKRSDGLFVFRKRAREVELLRPEAPVASGDLIQIGYIASDATHGVIFSLDGLGVVTLHHPAREDESTALEPFGRQLLPYSFELDGAPTYERILFVTGSRPIDVSAVLAAGRAMATRARPRLQLPRGLRVSDELLLRKRRRR